MGQLSLVDARGVGRRQMRRKRSHAACHGYRNKMIENGGTAESCSKEEKRGFGTSVGSVGGKTDEVSDGRGLGERY